MTSRVLLLSAPPDDVNTVHEFLDALWAEAPDVSPQDRMAFETALIELASNVLQHTTAPDGVTCTLTVALGEDGEIRAVLADTGEPGGVRLVTQEMPEPMAESGRGLALIQLLVDQLDYALDDGVNTWTIRKRRSPR